MIQVYDIQSNSFRNISQIKNNGLAYFSRESISVIKKYYIICGNYCIDNFFQSVFLIDVQNYDVIIPEAILILLNSHFVQEIEKYNVCNEQPVNLSFSFFYFNGQIEEHERKEIDPLTLVCEFIIKNKKLLTPFIAKGKSLVFPVNISELYSFSNNIYSLIQFDYMSKDYEIQFKYTIDALINGYHMNFSLFEIKKYAYNICQLALEKLEENYA